MRTVDEIMARRAATDPFKFHSTTSCLTDINTVCESATVRCQTRYVTMDEEEVVASACDILKCQVGGLFRYSCCFVDHQSRSHELVRTRCPFIRDAT